MMLVVGMEEEEEECEEEDQSIAESFYFDRALYAQFIQPKAEF